MNQVSETCRDCGNPLERKPKGPAPKRCASCARARKATQDRTRPRKPPKPRESKLPCCAESATGTCPQHRQARKARYDRTKYEADTSEVARLFSVLGQDWQVERLPNRPEIDTADPELIRLAGQLKAREDERRAADLDMWGEDELDIAELA
jgi:hypothetical protein